MLDIKHVAILSRLRNIPWFNVNDKHFRGRRTEGGKQGQRDRGRETGSQGGRPEAKVCKGYMERGGGHVGWKGGRDIDILLSKER